MPDTTEHLRRFIADLEAERARVDEAIADARGILRKFESGPTEDEPTQSTTSPKRDAPGETPEPFTRKYSESSKTLMLRVLREAPQRLSLPQIQERLEADGKHFHRETLNAGLKDLLEKDEVDRIEAGDETPYKWLYGLANRERQYPRVLP